MHRMSYNVFMMTYSHFQPRVKPKNKKKILFYLHLATSTHVCEKKIFFFNLLFAATCVNTKFLFFNWNLARNVVVSRQTAWAPCNAFYFK